MQSSSKPNLPHSGLTKEDCDMMLPYLNAQCNLYPGEGPSCTQWVSEVLYSYEEYYSKMREKSFVVKLVGLSGYAYQGNLSGADISMDELINRIRNVSKFFKTNEVIKGQFSYNDDNGYWYITDVAVLAALKEKAQQYNAIKAQNSKPSSVKPTLFSAKSPLLQDVPQVSEHKCVIL